MICIFNFQRKRHMLALKKKRCLKRKEQAAEYAKLLAHRQKEKLAKKRAEQSRKRTLSQSSVSSSGTKSSKK